MKYNHAVSISFTVVSENEEPTTEEIGDRLMEIMEESHSFVELVETAEVFDTIEEDDDE